MTTKKKKRPSQIIKLSHHEAEQIIRNLKVSNMLITVLQKTSQNIHRNDPADYIIREFHIESYSTREGRLYLIPKDKKKSTSEIKILYHFQTPKMQYLSTGLLRHNKRKNEFSIQIVEPIYKYEKRNNFRVQIPPSFTAFLKLGKIEYKILNISIEGLALYIYHRNLKYFAVKKIFQNARIRIDQEIYEVPECRVCHIHKLDEKSYMVGFEFTKLPSHTRAGLAAEINYGLFSVVEEKGGI